MDSLLASVSGLNAALDATAVVKGKFRGSAALHTLIEARRRSCSVERVVQRNRGTLCPRRDRAKVDGVSVVDKFRQFLLRAAGHVDIAVRSNSHACGRIERGKGDQKRSGRLVRVQLDQSLVGGIQHKKISGWIEREAGRPRGGVIGSKVKAGSGKPGKQGEFDPLAVYRIRTGICEIER